MGIYAMVNDNTVTNIIIADDKAATEVALSCILVEIAEQTPLGIGWQLINGEWTAPRETDNGY